MKNSFFILLFVCIYSCVNAQANLVMNPSFEEDSFCTAFYDGFYQRAVYDWKSPNRSAAYYINICANPYNNPDRQTTIPSNVWGYEFPYTGIAYAGVGLYAQLNDGFSYRQYIQGTLRDTLLNGNWYGIRIFISKAEIYQRYCQSNIGIYFSKNDTFYNTEHNLAVTPQFQNDTNNGLIDTLGWQKIEGSFIANGGEKYLIIGNFEDNAHTKIFDCFNNGTNLHSPYGEMMYFIDDVSVIDTSIIDTVQLCVNDSVFLQGAWRKTAGIYYDTIAGMPYQKYVQPKTYASTHTNFFFDGIPTDSFFTGYFWSHIFPQKDTTFSLIVPSIHGCDSVLVFRLRDRSIGIESRPTFTTNDNVSLLIYPNPAEQNINFLISKLANKNTAGLKIEIYDAVGRNIKYDLLNTKSTNESTEFKINISNFSRGMYFVKVFDKNNRSIANAKFICR
jgi:hypothetical protein